MPKQRAKDDEAPRGALTGFLIGAVKRHPRDVAAGTIAFAAICAIVGNAIFMQAGRHPSPMFGPPPAFSNAAAPSIPNPLPRPRTLEAVQSNERGLDSRLFDNKPQETRAPAKVEAKAEPRAEPATEMKIDKPDPMASLIRHAATPRPQPQSPARSQAQIQPMPQPPLRPVAQVAPSPVQIMSNPNVPRPPAAVPTASRGDPLADLISRGR